MLDIPNGANNQRRRRANREIIENFIWALCARNAIDSEWAYYHARMSIWSHHSGPRAAQAWVEKTGQWIISPPR